MNRKTTYKTRTPKPKTRDPVVETRTEHPREIRKPRRYIPANTPTLCPDCGHNTRMDDGRHIDPVRKRILEYRTCSNCGAKLAAGRAMTEIEADRLCTRADAVAEYESAEVLKK